MQSFSSPSESPSRPRTDYDRAREYARHKGWLMVKTTTNPDPNQGYTLTILRIPGAEPTALFFEDGQDPRGDFLRLVYAHGGTDFFAEHPQPLAQS